MRSSTQVNKKVCIAETKAKIREKIRETRQVTHTHTGNTYRWTGRCKETEHSETHR